MATSLGLSHCVIGVWAPSPLRSWVQEIVRQAGGRSIVAVDEGMNVTALVDDKQVDVLLVDETAVAPDPWELAAQLRSRLPAEAPPPVVLMTSRPTREKLERSLAAGIGSMIAKPFSAQTLISHVARVLPADRARDTDLPDQVFLD